MALARGVVWAILHAYRQKIRPRWRRRLWRAKRSPFEHRAARNLLFRLYPGEYVDGFIFVDGIYEERFLNFVRSHYRRHPGMIALDIGSNIGNHALYLSDCFRQIHCFDPNPTVVERLKENVHLNGIDNIVVHEIGLSNSAGELPFIVNQDGNLGNSHFVESADEGSILLPIVVGDDYLEEIEVASIDFIKVDVENHEPEVFEGLRRTISRYRPVLAFEYHGSLVERDHFDRIQAVLDGYILAETRYANEGDSAWKKLRWHVTNCGWPTLSVFTEPERRSYENILAFPDQRTLDQFRLAKAI